MKVHRARDPLLDIFRGARHAGESSMGITQGPGVRNLLKCQGLCFTTPASHCMSLRVAETKEGSETSSCLVFRHALSELLFLQLFFVFCFFKKSFLKKQEKRK